MILNINLSEDKELRKATLKMVQEAVASSIRDIVSNTNNDAVMRNVRASIDAAVAKVQVDFERCNLYEKFRYAVLDAVMQKFDMNRLRQDIINEVADRIFKGAAKEATCSRKD